MTALAGQVLKLNGKPLVNATLQIGEKSALTDRTGRFLLRDIPGGRHTLTINGHTADRPGRTYCMFDVAVDIEVGRTNLLGFTSWMPVQDMEHATEIPVPTTRDIVATTPRMPGLEVHIPAGVVLRTEHGDPLTRLTLTPVPLDRPPFPLPEGTKLFFTPQSHGAIVETLDGSQKGVRITYPNYTGMGAGTSVDLWSYDAKGVGWYTYGQGIVSADGRQIVPAPGVSERRVGCLHILGSPTLPPATWPPPGSWESGGDPVHLGTGLFVLDDTDLFLPAIIPIGVTRTYRQNDTASHAFGIGMSCGYDMYMVGDATAYTYAELILQDGGRVRYNRTSSGTGYADAVMEHTGTPTAFLKSTLSRDNTYNRWVVKFVDGTV